MHRRHLLRSIRTRVRASGFKKGVGKLPKATSVDWAGVADLIGECGGLKEALLSSQVGSDVKNALVMHAAHPNECPFAQTVTAHR